MKKIFRFLGIAVLAAAFSCATSSCEKESSSVISEEAPTEEAVDFGRLATVPVEATSQLMGNIEDAVVDIVNNSKFLLDAYSDTYMPTVEEFKVQLFELFTSRFNGESVTFDSKKFFRFVLNFAVNNKGAGNGNNISASCKDRSVVLETSAGYYLKVFLPDWAAEIFEKGGSFGNCFDLLGTEYTIEIGKGDIKYARNILDTESNSSNLAVYDLNDNDKQVAGTSLKYGSNSISYEFWYDNAESRGDYVAGTNILAKNLDEISSALLQVNDTYSLSSEEAQCLADAFNGNVTAHSECTIAFDGLQKPAIIEGEPLYAKCLCEQSSGKYKICIMHGKNVVDTKSLLLFIENHQTIVPGIFGRRGKVTLLSREKLTEIFSSQANFAELDIDAADNEYSKLIKNIRSRVTSNYESGKLIASISMTYKSVGPSGWPVTLSGKIYVPCVDGDHFRPIKGVVVNLFGTSPQGEGLLSNAAPLLYTYKYLATNRFAVFEPDYIGFGESSYRMQTYLCQHLIARNCADMLVAGINLLQDEYDIEFDDDWGTYVTGYSQGGGNALALTRYLTVEASNSTKDLVKLKKSYCGAGPYNPSKTFSTWVERGGMCMSLILPMVLYGMNEGHSDIFKGERLKDYFCTDYWNEGIPLQVRFLQDSYSQSLQYDVKHKKENGLKGILGPEVPLECITTREVLTEGSEKNTKLQKALATEIVCDDWTPETEILLYGDEKDNVVPYVNTTLAYDALEAKAPALVDSVKCSIGDHILTMLKYNAYIADIFLDRDSK